MFYSKYSEPKELEHDIENAYSVYQSLPKYSNVQFFENISEFFIQKRCVNK